MVGWRVRRAAVVGLTLSAAWLGAVLQTGCTSLWGRSPVVNPEAWGPQTTDPVTAGGDANPAPRAVTTQRALRAGDQVSVTMRTSLNASGDVVVDVIDDAGMMTLPLLGEFKISGMTTSEAERAIAKEYVARGYYIDMVVNVVSESIRETTSEEFSITGEIRQRGRFPLKEGMTLWQAIIAAGDVTDYASDSVLLTRGGVTKSFSIARIRKGSILDPVIRNGDIIQIQARIF